jgi:glyceraldehyde-3-phosphate dehydrogenase/erythrose-4-phosphate dehydrogenase
MTRIAINGLGRVGRAAFKQIIEDGSEAASARYRDIVGMSDEAIGSTDIVHDPRASIDDCTLTQVVGAIW